MRCSSGHLKNEKPERQPNLPKALFSKGSKRKNCIPKRSNGGKSPTDTAWQLGQSLVYLWPIINTYMRLGQLARKLSLRPSQLVDILALNNIPTEEGSNTRLTDEHTVLIVQHFAPDRLEEIMQPTEETAQPEPEPAAEEVVQAEPEQTTEKPLEETVVAETEALTDPQPDPETEVIRVQKIELSGLKV